MRTAVVVGMAVLLALEARAETFVAEDRGVRLGLVCPAPDGTDGLSEADAFQAQAGADPVEFCMLVIDNRDGENPAHVDAVRVVDADGKTFALAPLHEWMGRAASKAGKRDPELWADLMKQVREVRERTRVMPGAKETLLFCTPDRIPGRLVRAFAEAFLWTVELQRIEGR